MKDKEVKLRLDDLNSAISFESWVKEVTGDYKDKKVPISVLEIYLNYIKSKLDDIVCSNKAEWKNSIKKINKRLKDGRDK